MCMIYYCFFVFLQCSNMNFPVCCWMLFQWASAIMEVPSWGRKVCPNFTAYQHHCQECAWMSESVPREAQISFVLLLLANNETRRLVRFIFPLNAKADAGVWLPHGAEQVWPVRNETKHFNLAGASVVVPRFLSLLKGLSNKGRFAWGKFTFKRVSKQR